MVIQQQAGATGVSACSLPVWRVQGYASCMNMRMHMTMLTSSLSVLRVMKGKGIQLMNLAPMLNSSGGSFVNERCSSSRGAVSAASVPGGEPAAGTGSLAAAATVGCCGWLPAESGAAAAAVSAAAVGGEAGVAAGGAATSVGEPWINLTDPGCSTVTGTAAQQPAAAGVVRGGVHSGAWQGDARVLTCQLPRARCCAAAHPPPPPCLVP